MLSVCFVAFQLANGGSAVYMLPNCNPKHTANMDCKIESMSEYARPVAVCFDKKTKERIYFGMAQKDTIA